MSPTPLNLDAFEFETVTVNRRGEIIKGQTQTARYFREDLGNGVSLDMVYVPGGSFIMGAPVGERGSSDNAPDGTYNLFGFRAVCVFGE